MKLFETFIELHILKKFIRKAKTIKIVFILLIKYLKFCLISSMLSYQKYIFCCRRAILNSEKQKQYNYITLFYLELN